MAVAVWAALMALMALLVACGDNDGNGGGDTLLTGFSGVVILVIVVWLIVPAQRKRG